MEKSRSSLNVEGLRTNRAPRFISHQYHALSAQYRIVRIERAFADDFRIIEIAKDLDLQLGADRRVVRRKHRKCYGLADTPAEAAARCAARDFACIV